MTQIDYKSTLNLPNTQFPMRANLPQREPDILAKWQSLNLYETVRAHNEGKEKFILHFGPPYANGDIHIGHAVTSILKDIVVKSKLLSGYDAPLVPGWDCHGLPIEINVEKKLGAANVDVDATTFRQACRDYALSQIALQKASFKRLGILADWDNPYLTMDYHYQANIVRALGKILAKGYLHAGVKPVHWCINCGSALAEAEVEYQNKNSPAVDVCFTLADTQQFFEAISYPVDTSLKEIAVVIWTTTPWTLPANEAVALHPELEYSLVKIDAGRAIILLNELLTDCLHRYGYENAQILATFPGKKLEKLRLFHPFYEKQVPIIVGDHVTTDAGTGAVHTAPAHGAEDYLMGLTYQLPIETPVGDNGCFFDKVPLVGGMHVFKANEKIVEILKENHKLLHFTTLNHSYPHCWRHKTALIFRATPQWFMSMSAHDLRQKVLAGIQQVKWIPNWGQSRITSMIEGRPDWCLSRQRTWGVPLTLVIHKESHELHPQMTEIIELVASRIEKEGVEAWYALDLAELPFKDLNNYRKVNDILDVWFDSGVSHSCVLKERPELQFPADLYLEGSDQHRGWFQSSLLSSVAMYDEPPYKNVLTHGFTVDAQGRKMSKSLGNVILPEKVIKNLGADILRLWVAATDYKGEIHVSDEILTRMADAYRRIRNTARFLLANLNGFDPKAHLVPSEKLIALDAWIVDFAAQMQEEIIQLYDNCQFQIIYQKIHNFCVVELGSFYLDVIKDRQYTTQTNSLARRSAQTAMYWLAHALTRWLAPILSFTAEEIWEHLPGSNTQSIFLTQWFDKLPRLATNSPWGNSFWQKMIQVRAQINKALEQQRNEGRIGAPLDASVTLYAQGELYEWLMQLGDELRFVLITSAAIVKPAAQKSEQALATEFNDLWVEVVPSADEKCIRCWHHLSDVNHYADYPQLCGRCVLNVDPQKEGEIRHYA